MPVNPLYLGVGAGVTALGDIVGGLINTDAATRAAAAQSQSVAKGQQDITQGYSAAKTSQQPYYDVGTQGMQTLAQKQAAGGYSVVPSTFKQTAFNPTSFDASNITNDQGYQFRLQQGSNAVQNSAAARGSGLSGATLKALDQYGQGFASNELNNAYMRNLQTNQQGMANSQFQNTMGFNTSMEQYNQANQQALQDYQRQAGIAGMGQTAAGSLANIGMGQGQQMSDLDIQGGNAAAAGIMGSSLGNTIQNIGGGIGGALMGFGLNGGMQNAGAKNYNMQIPTSTNPGYSIPNGGQLQFDPTGLYQGDGGGMLNNLGGIGNYDYNP